jgi:hypothetical protein
VTVQGSQVTIPTGNSANAAIDTGTTLIGAPQAAVEAIYAAIPNSKSLDSIGMKGFWGFRTLCFSAMVPFLNFKQLAAPMYQSPSPLEANYGPSMLRI